MYSALHLRMNFLLFRLLVPLKRPRMIDPFYVVCLREYVSWPKARTIVDSLKVEIRIKQLLPLSECISLQPTLVALM